MTSKSFLRLIQVTTVALLGLGCVTINVYFPEEAVKDLSEKIEDAVAREAAEGESASGGSKNQAALPTSPSTRPWDRVVFAALALVPAPTAEAQVADPGISNPAIRRIIESRATRIGDITRFKQSGLLGENNQALLEARDLQAASLADRAAIQRLVRDENADREQMFKEIAAATGADPSTLDQIRETYAETLRQKAKAGDWIQLPNGTWQQKA